MPILNLTDFSGVRASFFAGLSNIQVRRTPEKNNGIVGSPSLILSKTLIPMVIRGSNAAQIRLRPKIDIL